MHREILPAVLLALLLLIAFGAKFWNMEPKIEEYGSQHVHADFLVVINDETLNFSAAKYQSNATVVRSPIVHLHDGNGHVVHSHAFGITWQHFFLSLGFSLNESCLVTDQSYCTNTSYTLFTYRNGKPASMLWRTEIRDLDQVVITYLPKDAQGKLNKALQSVTDEACIPSGKCPERGSPAPEESCAGECIVAEGIDE